MALFGIASCGIGLPNVAAAEGERPADRPLALPPLAAPDEATPEVFVLPPIPPARETLARPGADHTLRVERFSFVGNVAIPDAELAARVARFSGREITVEELAQARDAVTLYYVESGYPTSGALLPDQDVGDGAVELRIVEGELETVSVETDGRLRPGYVAKRIERAADPPLHLRELERRIAILQQDPLIDRVDASLQPGSQLGRSRLSVRVTEARPYRATLEVSNHAPPSLGDVRGRVWLEHGNLTGFGDRLFLLGGGQEAGGEFEARYGVPLNAYDTTLELGGRLSDNELVDDIGSALDIEGRFWSVEVGLRQPLIRTPTLEVAVAVTGALRESKTELLGIEINEVGDRTRVAVLRFEQELLWRGGAQVFGLRSMVSRGLDVFDATRASRANLPDGRFLSWLAQAQWVRRIDPWGLELIARGDIQLSEKPLLTLEQYSLGGHGNVRGYRENQLVRDQGASGSAELRIPLWRESVEGRAVVQLAPFFDIGRAWNRSRPETKPRTLSSAGVSLIVRPLPYLRGEIHWAHPLTNLRRADGLQGEGVQFRVVASWP